MSESSGVLFVSFLFSCSNTTTYALDSIVPAELENATVVLGQRNQMLVCASINDSGAFFPIVRRSNWRSATFLSTLSQSQKARSVRLHHHHHLLQLASLAPVVAN